MGVTDVVKDAEDFLKEAEIELENGKASDDKILIRDSAEKGWNAIVQAVNALCEVLLGRVPKSHYDRRNALREIEKKFPELENLVCMTVMPREISTCMGRCFTREV